MIHEATQQFTAFPGVSEQVYCQRDFEAIRTLIYERAGIVLPPGKSTLVYSRIAPLVRATNSATFNAYLDLIRRDQTECRKAVSALTTNHTFFWREAHHFDFFRAQIRPGLVDRLRGGEPVRIWSAGSSSGEEVYSLMMSLLGPDRTQARRIAQGDLAVLASDLSDPALAKARAAQYDPGAVEPLPDDLRALWVQNKDGMAHIAPDITNLVRFRSLNLLGDWPIKRRFDVIFCRNVMIYFDQPTREKLIERFADQLEPGGHLFIGHSERVTGPATRLLEPVALTTYRKISA